MMSYVRFGLLAAAVSGLFCTSAYAGERAAEVALDSVNNLLDALDDEDRACRKAVQSPLRDVHDQLDRLSDRFRGRRAERVARELGGLSRDARADCSRRFAKKLRRAALDFEDAIKEGDRGYREDRHDRRRSRSRRSAPCWNADDPGCGARRGGKGPMTKSAFSSVLSAVKSAKPHVYPMQDVLRPMVANQYMTSLQLSLIVEHFKPHVYPMQDVVKMCAPRLVDPENGGVVTAQFKPHVFPMQDVAKLIAAQSRN